VTRVLSGAVWLSLVVGCASPLQTMREDNRRLSHTVSELRGERRAQERKLRDLQRQLDQARAQKVTELVGSAPPPELRVEVAAPPPGVTMSRVVGMTDDGEEIVYEGDAAAGKVATMETDEPTPRHVPDRIAIVPRASARTARTPIRDREAVPTERSGDAGNEYRLAVELVKAGRHDDAVSALRAFIARFPQHDFADNAQYWLGESYYAAKDYPNALLEFRAVIETYPRGNKVPDALLKVGYCYLALRQNDKARAVLEQVVNLYPRTPPAAIAAKRLETP
jgi:tol-pal system protein YbgF